MEFVENASWCQIVLSFNTLDSWFSCSSIFPIWSFMKVSLKWSVRVSKVFWSDLINFKVLWSKEISLEVYTLGIRLKISAKLIFKLALGKNGRETKTKIKSLNYNVQIITILRTFVIIILFIHSAQKTKSVR